MIQGLRKLYYIGRWGLDYEKALKTHRKRLFIALAVLISVLIPSFCLGITWSQGDATLSGAGIFTPLDISDFIFEGCNNYPNCSCLGSFYSGEYPNIVHTGSGFSTTCSTITTKDLEADKPVEDDIGWYWYQICDNEVPTGICHYYDFLYRVDTFGNWILYPNSGGVIIISSPEAGSTITDTATELIIYWAGIDSDYWTKIGLGFNDYLISEESARYDISLSTDNGNVAIPLSEFAIPKNGLWTLVAVVSNSYNEINFDIPNPIYALIFNVSGLPTPYAFTDFEDWYSVNVEDYEAPSAWASAMVGYLEPIFEKIGEFGNRITVYLDTSLAYEKGFSIGSVFPVILAYVYKIDVFFGGFPIVQFFKWIILIMIGLFAVKVILKLLSFIPFFGGGG